jgi:hypothetical protein
MIHLRPLTAADLPLGLHLSRQAGWNQTPDDWRRCLELQPEGCFVAECDGAGAVAAGRDSAPVQHAPGWLSGG